MHFLQNLLLAERLHNDTMTIPCASCYQRMKVTKAHMDEDPALAGRINSTIVGEGSYEGKVAVKSMLQYCYEDVGLDAIKAKVTSPISGMKLACYYGCLLTRPKAITQFDSPEYPMSMDHIVEALGAKATAFDLKPNAAEHPSRSLIRMLSSAQWQDSGNGEGKRGPCHRSRLPPLPVEPRHEAARYRKEI